MLPKKLVSRLNLTIFARIGQLPYLSDHFFSRKKSDNYGTYPKIGQLRYIYCILEWSVKRTKCYPKFSHTCRYSQLFWQFLLWLDCCYTTSRVFSFDLIYDFRICCNFECILYKSAVDEAPKAEPEIKYISQ